MRRRLILAILILMVLLVFMAVLRFRHVRDPKTARPLPKSVTLAPQPAVKPLTLNPVQASEIPFEKIKAFFDYRTGKPLIYYSQDKLGCHFFAHDGFDPVSGLPLKPVTTEIVEACGLEAAERRQGEKARVAEVEKPPSQWTYKLMLSRGKYRTITSPEPPYLGLNFKVFDHEHEAGNIHLARWDNQDHTAVAALGDCELAARSEMVLVPVGQDER